MSGPGINRTPSERRGWGINKAAPQRTVSNSSLKHPNKLHQAIVQRDLTKLRQRLQQAKKAKVELLEVDHMDQTPLEAALRLNNYEFVRELVEFYKTSRSEINIQDKNGYTALHVAASSCDDQILMLLLNCEDIDVNVPNDDSNTPLHYFCQMFKSPNCQEPFQLFLKRGVNVNAQNKNGETALHKSIFNHYVRLMVATLLLEAGANVNILNSRGESPLHFAVRLGREDLVTVLIKAGADPTVRGSEGKSCYELAVQGPNTKVSQMLKAVQDIHDWLLALDLEQYSKVFVKEEIYKDILPDLSEATLDAMNITSYGHRIKIIRACQAMKNNPPPAQSPNGTSHHLKSNELSTPRKLSSNSNSAASSDSISSITSEELRDTLASMEHLNMTADQWVIDHTELEYTLKLGQGSSGKVYKGLFKRKEVAVKVLKQMTTQAQLDEFKKEFQIMCAIRSPYMVTFYGACLEPKLCMVMEFCSRDSLYHVMNRTTDVLDWEKFFKFALQMVRGMDCLHSWTPQIVHRDFKSLNLLVNEAWDCKVCDFGLSRFNTVDNLETMGKVRGTLVYCAPEVCTGSSPYTSKSDVYSIGIVLWELVARMITGEYQRPYSEYPALKMDYQIILNAKEGVRPTMPPETPELLKETYRLTVSPEPEDRPSCPQIIERLLKLEAEWQADKAGWDALRRTPPAPLNQSSS